jgi:ABC-type sugar transport system substrate-binding protein
MSCTWLRRCRPLAVFVTGLIALFVSACGSTGSNSSGSSGSSTLVAARSSDLAALRAVVASHTSASHIGPTTPIGKAVPKGKHLVFVNCGQPACVLVNTSLTAAAQTLGWTVSTVNAQPTPPAVQAAFDQAIRQHPDGVASIGLGRSLYPRELAQLNSLHIPVLSAYGEQESGQGGITLDPIGPNETSAAMAVLADKAIVDMHGQGLAGSVLLGGFPIIKNYTAAYTAEIKAKCPGCTQAQLTIQPTDLGKDAATLITNFLRANPGMKTLFLSYGVESDGLSAAAKGAGVTLPGIYAWAPEAPGIQSLQTGEWKAAAIAPYAEVGWQLADGFARLFTGDPVSESQTFQNQVLWSKDFNNVPTTTSPFPSVVPSYQAQFKALWGVK